MKKIIMILIVFNSVTFSGWVTLNTGTNYYLEDIQVINSDIIYCGGENNQGIEAKFFKSTNGGINWTQSSYKEPLYNPYTVFGIHFINDQTGYVVANWGSQGELYSTFDSGNSWSNILLGQAPSITYSDINFVNGFIGYFDFRQSFISGNPIETLYKTTNNGINWIPVSARSGQLIKSIWFINELKGYGTQDMNIIKSTDGGMLWNVIYSSLSYLSRIEYCDALTGIAIGLNLVVRTTDAGVSWNSVPFVPAVNYKGLTFIGHDTLYIVGDGGFILKSTNAGATFSTQISGTVNNLRQVSFVNSITGFVCGENGTILKTTNGGIITEIINMGNEIPNKFVLYQNYPNPFNPTTKIKFAIPLDSRFRPEKRHGVFNGNDNVLLKVFDALGREVQTLVNEPLQPGTYEVEFPAPTGDGSNFSIGVYYYILTSGDFKETKKMILIK
jgi:photosystem II stability/assembly factor-like uncharacterized protein